MPKCKPAKDKVQTLSKTITYTAPNLVHYVELMELGTGHKIRIEIESVEPKLSMARVCVWSKNMACWNELHRIGSGQMKTPSNLYPRIQFETIKEQKDYEEVVASTFVSDRIYLLNLAIHIL